MDFEQDAPCPAAPTHLDHETEVNHILDKILIDGIGSLTETEKRLLERASVEIQQRESTRPVR